MHPVKLEERCCVHPSSLGSKDGAVVRGLASHQCDPGSVPARCHIWVEFVVGSYPCSEGFSPGWVFLPPWPEKLTSPYSNLTRTDFCLFYLLNKTKKNITTVRDETTSALDGFHANPLAWSNWNMEMLAFLVTVGGKLNPEKNPRSKALSLSSP